MLKLRYLSYLFLLFICPYNIVAQTYQEKFDSINSVLSALDKNVTEELLETELRKLELCEFIILDSVSAEKIYKETLELAGSCKNRAAELHANLYYSKFLLRKSELEDAEKLLLYTYKHLSAGDEALKVEICTELARKYIHDGNFEESFSLLSDADVIAKKLGDARLMLTVNYYYGDYYYGLGDFGKSADYFQKTFDAAKNISLCCYYPLTLSYLGNIALINKNYKGAIDYYFKANDEYNRIGYLYGLAFSNMSIAYVFDDFKDYDKALEHYNKALEFGEKIKVPAIVASACFYIGNIYVKNEDPAKSLQFANKALSFSKETKTKMLTSDIYVVMAKAYILQNNNEKAFELLKKIDKINSETKNTFTITESKLLKARLYILERKYQQTIDELTSFKRNYGVQTQLFYDYLSQAYSGLGQYEKALINHKHFKRISDSIYNENTYKQLLSTSLQLDSEKEKQDIEYTKTLAERQKNIQLSKQRTVILIIAIIILMLTVGVVMVVVGRKNKLQKLKNLEADKKFLDSAMLVESLEKEQILIAEKIHDDIGGDLSALKYKLNLLNQSDKDILSLDKVINELRNISYKIAPPLLQRINIIEALKQYTSTIKEEKTIVFDFYGEVPNNIDIAKQTIVYRMAQELIDNIVKHSCASEAIVQIHYDRGTLFITIEDNGIGFDIGKTPLGSGLKNVFASIDLLNALINFESDKNGTNIEISIEIDNTQNSNNQDSFEHQTA